ncbi:hypothetical protein AOQ84DRAFT_444162 [Glonium stellatum]|uniref:Uncharacterized protein n=1 Tax=Glonium stellatum TaxID=574774 RepID=A0A8E2EM25_9PEZI|nr:hypothetical protein AOQ84DRAFT_444162 [Glonium stellatum]
MAHDDCESFATSPFLGSLQLNCEPSVSDTRLYIESPAIDLQLSPLIQAGPPQPDPPRNALPPSPPSSTPASDALALASGNGDFAHIFLKSRNHSSLKRRRHIVASASASHADLVSILLDLPPAVNASVVRVVKAILRPTPVLVSIEITELLQIYCDGELDFFKTFQNLNDDDFFDCRDKLREDVDAQRESAYARLASEQHPGSTSLQDCSIPSGESEIVVRDSGYVSGHASVAQADPSDFARLPSTSPFEQQPQGCHNILACYEASRTAASGNTHVRFSKSCSSDQRSLESQYPSPPMIAYSPGTIRDSPTALDLRYWCTDCPKTYDYTDNGFRRWSDHQWLEHNEKKTWTCAHQGCKKRGKKDGGYLVHHHKDHDNCTLNICPTPPTINITQRGRVACICLNCDQDTVYTGPECFKDLLAHYQAEHRDLVAKRLLNTSQRYHTRDMERLLHGRDKLMKSFQDYMKRFGACEQWPTLWFDEKHPQIVQLRRDLETRSFEDEPHEIPRFIDKFCRFGTAYLGPILSALASTGGHFPSSGDNFTSMTQLSPSSPPPQFSASDNGQITSAHNTPSGWTYTASQEFPQSSTAASIISAISSKTRNDDHLAAFPWQPQKVQLSQFELHQDAADTGDAQTSAAEFGYESRSAALQHSRGSPRNIQPQQDVHATEPREPHRDIKPLPKHIQREDRAPAFISGCVLQGQQVLSFPPRSESFHPPRRRRVSPD